MYLLRMKIRWVSVVQQCLMYLAINILLGNCVHHDGFVYDNTAADMTAYRPSDAYFLLNKIECDIIIDTERREDLERQKNKFKWICCGAVFVSGTVGGCKKGKHGFEISTNDEDEQQRIEDVTTTNCLSNKDVKQWEDTCFNKEDYLYKWAQLLGKRV